MSHFSPGDYVALLHGTERGYIKEVIGSKLKVETEDGFILLTEEKELVLLQSDESGADKNRPAKQLPPIDAAQLREQMMAGNIAYHWDEVLESSKGKEEVIDLHHDKLPQPPEDRKQLLPYQLQLFQQAIDRCVLQGHYSLTVIHGQGAGRLRDEVRRALKEWKSQIKSWKDLNDGGATLIRFSTRPK